MNNVINKKPRNSNYELMRMVSMFLIILSHIIYHGKIIENCTNPSLKIIFQFLSFLVLVHVNSFILLTGYFQSNSSFKQSKLWSLINASWFYRVVIIIALIFFGIINVNKVTFLKEILPINWNEYWFIKCYILLYCFSPFINKALLNFDKKSFQKLLLVLFITFSVLPRFTGNNFISNNGHVFYQFIYLYIVGFYLRKYPLSKSYLFRNMSNNLYKISLIAIFFGSILINHLSYYFCSSILSLNSFAKEFGGYIVYTSTSYSIPLVIIQSIAYFALFGALNINSKLINKLSSLVFGIYLIHDNNFIRSLLYKFFKIINYPIKSYTFVIYVFVVAIIIYVVCSMIEFLRQLLFKYIYNLKIAKKIRAKYYNYISSIYINNV